MLCRSLCSPYIIYLWINYPFKSEFRTFSKDSIPSVSSCGWDHTQDDVRAPGLMFHHPAALSLTGSAAQSRSCSQQIQNINMLLRWGSCREASFPGSVTVRDGPGCTLVRFFSPSVILKPVAGEANPTPLKLNLDSRFYRQTFSRFNPVVPWDKDVGDVVRALWSRRPHTIIETFDIDRSICWERYLLFHEAFWVLIPSPPTHTHTHTHLLSLLAPKEPAGASEREENGPWKAEE